MKKLYSKRFDFTNPAGAKHISGHENLTNFVNNNGIQKNDIVAITSDESNSNYTLFYYTEVGSNKETSLK
jgi:hypothetical protein